MYRAVTRQIEVTVEPNFLPERPSVENRQYFWSYTIVITNTGEETVQLRTRHWITGQVVPREGKDRTFNFGLTDQRRREAGILVRGFGPTFH